MRVKKTTTSSNPWVDKGEHSDFVTINEGTSEEHSIFVSVQGPARSDSKAPVLLFLAGAGAPAAVHVRLQPYLTSQCGLRTLFHDRAGYDKSTIIEGMKRITATDSAKDLVAVLQKIDLAPPYLLVAHSYGAFVAREFIDLVFEGHAHDEAKPIDQITGLVLYDAATELMFELFPRIPPPELAESIGKDVDWAELTNLKQDSGLTDEEWDRAVAAMGRTFKKLADCPEDKHGSGRSLASKRQYERKHTADDYPLSVVRTDMAGDFRKLYDAGVAKGAGSAEERRIAHDFVETLDLYHDQLARAQLQLSNRNRYVDLKEWGHDSPLRDPGLIATEVSWILNEHRKKIME